jgi:acetylornithine deacetylase/succinyl-diaminopimelate desuccinylase-like protein
MSREVLELCREMVAIASVNPQEAPEYGWPLGEERMVEFVSGWFEKYKLDYRPQEVGPGRCNVVATALGEDESKTLLLCAHTDTVGVEGMAIDPFDPVVKAGRLYGRGSCDTKASLAAMMIAFRDRVLRGALPNNLTLLASCGEEHDLLGAKAFAAEYGSRISGAVFGEPTQLKVVTCHKGAVRLRLVCEGKSAHSSTPQLGDNAITKMAQAVSAAQDYAARLEAKTSHEVLGAETLAVTIIKGGDQINIIPNRCEAFVEWRSLPGREPQACRDELAEALGSIAKVELMNSYAPMETDPNHPMVAALLDATKKGCGLRVVDGVKYATDASAFAEYDIATLVLGPGNIAQAHTADEFIEVDQLEKGLAVYGAFLAGDWGN